MLNVRLFIGAAAPWIIIGLVLAIFCVVMDQRAKRAKDNPKSEEKEETYGALGMVIGMSIGCAFGKLLFGNMTYGMSMGMLIGMLIGTSIKKKDEGDE